VKLFGGRLAEHDGVVGHLTQAGSVPDWSVAAIDSLEPRLQPPVLQPKPPLFVEGLPESGCGLVKLAAQGGDLQVFSRSQIEDLGLQGGDAVGTFGARRASVIEQGVRHGRARVQDLPHHKGGNFIRQSVGGDLVESVGGERPGVLQHPDPLGEGLGLRQDVPVRVGEGGRQTPKSQGDVLDQLGQDAVPLGETEQLIPNDVIDAARVDSSAALDRNAHQTARGLRNMGFLAVPLLPLISVHAVIIAAMIAACLLRAPASAQILRVPPYRTVAELGACTNGKPKLAAVTDGLTDSDCAVGGGAEDVPCWCLDGAWTAGGAGPQGATGPQGPAGADGDDGAAGADGQPRQVQEEGADLTVRDKVNFIGAGITCADNAGQARTDCTVAAGSGDVVGPASSTAAAVAAFSSTTGKALQNTGVLITTASGGGVQVGGASGPVVKTLGSGIVSFLQSNETSWSLLNAEGLRAIDGAGTIKALIKADELSMASGICLKAASGATAGGGDTTLCRASAGAWTVGVIRFVPQASPPVTCGSGGSEGYQYTDTSHALCYCNGTAWTNLTPADGGSCS
jgi:hypothetical protein